MRYQALLLLALLLIVTAPAFPAVEIYDAGNSAYVPSFIDYTLNCPADVTVEILPCDSQGNPTGPPVRTVTFMGQSRGFHRYVWMGDGDAGWSVPYGNYIPRLTAISNQPQWDPISGLYLNTDWDTEYASMPLPPVPDTEGFYGIGINKNPDSDYYGRMYVAHKLNKDIYMYGPDGTPLGSFDDSAVAWGTSAPWDVSVADDGYVYVGDRSNSTVYCFTPDGNLMSSGTGTYIRALFARTTSDGRTHIFLSGGSTGVKQVIVEPDHLTWTYPPIAYNTGGGDGWDAWGMWVSQDLRTIYQACLQGPSVGLTKWDDPTVDGTYVKDSGFGGAGIGPCVDVDMGNGCLWVTRMVAYANDDPGTTQNERSRAILKVNPANGSIISDEFDIVSYGHMVCTDGVGNPAVTFGKNTATWGQRYWGLFAEAGISTSQKLLHVMTGPSSDGCPVVVPDSAVWTPDNIIAGDDIDTATVSVKVMDANGWADITSVALDQTPIGYPAKYAVITPDTSDPTGKTAIATFSNIKAKAGARCTTSYGQPPHFLTVTPRDSTNCGWGDPEVVQIQVTGDPMFDAYIKHRRVSNWYVQDAQIVAIGGGIPGTTDPRAEGPFTYTSAPSDASGYSSLELSYGTFAVKAQKTGFGSETPTGISVPYTGYTVDLYLRPLTIAEARNAANGTKVNVEGVCYAQPVGLPPTAAPGLAPRTDTGVLRNQWYVCDPNSPANGMLFMVTAPTASFEPQWDEPLGGDLDIWPPTYIGKRPEVGETTMITGVLDIPGGHERRALIQDADLLNGLFAYPPTVERVYLNLGNLGGLPASPVSANIPDIYHEMVTAFKEGWGKYVQITGATVVAVHADGLPNPNPGDPDYTFPPYFTVVDAAGNWCEVVLETPTSLNATAWTSTVTVGKVFTITGAQGRRTRYGNGCIRIRSLSDLTQAGTQGVLQVDLAPAAAVTAGAQWRRVGTTTWKNSGVYEPLAAGSYNVEFTDLTGYVTPATQPVTVTDAAVTVITGTYTQYGALQVNLLPAEAVAAGAQWRRVGTTTWKNSGDTESLPPGDYTVEFKAVTGLLTPPPRPVTITSGVTTTSNVTYSICLDCGGLDEVSAVRSRHDGDPVNVHGIVSAKIGSAMWVQDADGGAGIRVEGTSASVEVGDDAQVAGAIDIDADGEMVIVPSIILEYVNGTTAPAALDMRSRDIGGVSCGTTPGVDTGRGSLNVGLKVHFLGMVTSAGTDSYYLWDGANRSDAPTSDGTGTGVLIEAAPPAGVVAWQDWVDVTGVVGIKLVGGVHAPTIIPISASKVTSFDTISTPAGTAVRQSWNLLSVPAAPAGTSDGDEFTPKPWDDYMVLGPNQSPDDIDGRLYRWESCTGGLELWDQWSEVASHGPFGGLVLGDGFWLEAPDDWSISYSGKNSTLDQWISVCAPGWMMVGHPKDHNTRLEDVLVHDGSAVYSMFDAVLTDSWIDCTGYWWDNSTQGLVDIGIPDCWSSTDTLQPWHGYWMQFYRGDLALIVPESPAAP